MPNFIANWPAPSNISALTTTRSIGLSKPPYDNNNLALHVGDDDEAVKANRLNLKNSLLLPGEPIWLSQTHSNQCVIVETDQNRNADASTTRHKDMPLVIMTADCLPILLCDKNGHEIAAIHAGWKGLVNGIIENTLSHMHTHKEALMAWIGPAICKACYEVGNDMYEAYINRYPYTEPTFTHHDSHRYANLPKMAELILKAQGVNAVYQSGACCYELKNKFYSYRSEAQTGRMATLIWFNNN